MPPRTRLPISEIREEIPEVEIPIRLSQIENDFWKHNPPMFNGTSDPMDAEKWIRALERIFNFMACTDEERLSCAQFQLTDDADYWWESTVLERRRSQNFRIVAKEDLLSQSMIEILINCQGQDEMTYAQTLSRALNIESIMSADRVPQQSLQQTQDPKGKKKWEDNSRGNFQGRRQPWQENNQNNQFNQQRNNGPCPRCHRNNRPPQRPNQGNNPRPNQENNFRPQQGGNPRPNQGSNPKPNQGRNSAPNQGQRGQQQARVYALNQQQAAQNPENLAGMINLLAILVLALFDTGATHSFISQETCEQLNLRQDKVVNALEVSIPSGKTLIAEKMFLNIELDISDKKFKIDLYVIKMKDFDLILGMDWLTTANLGCFLTQQEKLVQEFENLRIELVQPPSSTKNCIAALTAKPDLRERIVEAQKKDGFIEKMRSQARSDDPKGFAEAILSEDLTYEEKPIAKLDQKVQVLRNKQIQLVKVLWSNHGSEEATWELKDKIQEQYPDLPFREIPNSSSGNQFSQQTHSSRYSPIRTFVHFLILCSIIRARYYQAKEKGVKPNDMACETFKRLHDTANGSYSDKKSCRIAADVLARIEELSQPTPGTDEAPQVDMSVVYVDTTCQHSKKNPIFGLDSRSRSVSAPSVSSAAPP
ncbi:hypothetical protein C2S52_006720 [Perilla frutescens var. hirtella]|nr:hypothetical protein C2S52_006720 [Perilla frutescens var. hirtella]